MAKSKKTKLKQTKGKRATTKSSKVAQENTAATPPKRDYAKPLGYIGLVVILLFSCFLRYENFSVWQQKKTEFQYEGEYQMSNFDSYYYLRLAKDIQTDSYHAIDEKRQLPNEKARPTFPPLLSSLTSGISTLTGISLASVAIFMPVVLSASLGLVVFFICLRLKLHVVSTLLATLFSVISLTYVARTRIGVFDTDSLNVVFPLINSYLCYCFIQAKGKFKFTYLAVVLVNTVLYLMWWNTASSVVVLSLMIPLVVSVLFFYEGPKLSVKLGVLAVISLVSLFLIKDQAIALVELVLGTKTTAFPNNMDISELDKVGFTDFVAKSLGNTFLVIVAAVGVGYFGYKYRLKTPIFALPILLAFAPFLAGNRFIAFSAPIMGLGIGLAVQALFDQNKRINPAITSLLAVFIGIIGIVSTYKTITDKYQPPAAYENVSSLTAIKNKTPEQANIWTDADLGYQIQYYLDRGTYADGEFEDGELRYYLYYPLAADKLSLSANFMKFYQVHGIKGLKQLYAHFPSIPKTFNFLDEVLRLKPLAAQQWLAKQQKEGKLPAVPELATLDDWLVFLYPEPKEELYLFLYYKMTQTASWFKQGNADLTTGETKGLPLFLMLNGLTETGGLVQNNQIKIDTVSGRALYMNGTKHAFQYVLSYDRGEAKKWEYNTAGQLLSANQTNPANDQRFAFQWNKQSRFGAALSREMGETTLVQLYLQNTTTDYFEAVDLKAPMYQIWKVHGDVYTK